MTLGWLYAGLLAFGTAYALLTAVFGWFADHGGLGDVHVDASGHLDAGQPHPLSGTVVATFLTGFGAGGTLAHYLLEWGTLAGLATATLSGMVLAGAAFAVLEMIFSRTQAGSEFAEADAEGRSAEVITAIPAEGSGEIAYLVKAQRVRAAARSAAGEPIAKGRLVVIEKMLGATAYVRPRQ